MQTSRLKQFSEFISTVLYLGKIPIAPGTIGSLVAFPLCYIVATVYMHFYEGYDDAQIFFWIVGTLSIILFFIIIIGYYTTKIYVGNDIELDPKEVVIDEVAGQMLVILLTFFSIVFIDHSSTISADNFFVQLGVFFVLPFTLFRLFDVLKPWPIDWCDKNIKGAFGIMIDDIVAAIFASVCHYVIIFIIIDQYSI